MCVLVCVYPCMARAGALVCQQTNVAVIDPYTADGFSSFVFCPIGSSCLAPPFSLERFIVHPTTPSPHFHMRRLAAVQVAQDRQCGGGTGVSDGACMTLLLLGCHLSL